MELMYLTWNPGFISSYHGNKICQIKHYLKNLKGICFVNIIVFLFYNSVLHIYIYIATWLRVSFIGTFMNKEQASLGTFVDLFYVKILRFTFYKFKGFYSLFCFVLLFYFSIKKCLAHNNSCIICHWNESRKLI